MTGNSAKEIYKPIAKLAPRVIIRGMRGIFALLLLFGAAASAQPVATSGGFIDAAPSVMDNVGEGDLREYFFRFWDAASSPPAWSPMLPKICHSGYEGLAADPAEQFKVKYIDGRYVLAVRYDVSGALGVKADKTATPVVYSWQKSSVNGQKCLTPIFVPSGMTPPLDAPALLEGKAPSHAIRIEVLPCGVLFDDDPPKDADFSGENFIWNPLVRRFECKQGFARRESSLSGAPMMTYVDFYMDFPNNGGLRSRINIRRCFECR